MIGLFCFVLAILASPFKSKSRLEAENAVLRHQLIVLRRKMRGRPQLTNNDRWFFIQLYRWFPSILQVLTIIRPETLARWHRAGFRAYWGWKSRRAANPKRGKCILKKTSENATNLRLRPGVSRRVKIAAPALAHKLGVLDVIEASLPGYLSENDRKDIIADMWTAVAEGRLLPTEVCTRARQFVSAHHKMYPTTDRWAPASLDAPIRDDNPLPRLERIAEGEGLWS